MPASGRCSRRTSTDIVPSVPPQVTTGLEGVTAVVLTHRRPRLAGELVRALIAREGFRPDQVLVVVNREGGLDDPALEAAVRVERLATNTGPAGGFRAGLVLAFEDPATEWAYLCEDDVGLLELPTPRVEALLQRVGSVEGKTVGAVVAYGRRFDHRGHAANVMPRPGDPALVPVDVGAWGATLVHRRVVEMGVLPDPGWFFGFEDFDFFSRVRSVGLDVLLDSASARAVAATQTSHGRADVMAEDRPIDADEPWRAYYLARNFFHLARAHGSPRWLGWHLAYSARRLQLASSNAERVATLHGLFDGLRARRGPHPRYLRTTGERAPTPE
jgi:hypothetical protein